MSSVSARCNDSDSSMYQASMSNGIAKTQVHRLDQLTELDLAPSFSRSETGRSRRSVSPKSDTTHLDMNRELTSSSSPRLQRPITLSPPPPNFSHNPHSTTVIPGQYNNFYYNNQDVHPLLSVSSASNNFSSDNNSNVANRSPSESSNFQSSNHVSINQSSNSPHRTSQVFTNTSDLAAHYGIPQFLPPVPRTTPRRISSDSLDQTPPEPQFASLCSDYLTMLSQEPGETNVTEDHVSSVPDSEFTPSSDGAAAVRALMDVLQGESFGCKCTACAYPLTHSPSSCSTATPDLTGSSSDDFSEFLTSPFIDSPFDELMTPVVGSEMDPGIYTSPVMDWGNSTFSDEPLFNDAASESYSSLFSTTKQSAPEVMDTAQMWSISPSTPALIFDDSPPTGTKPLPASRRKNTATGTRKNVTPENLVPIDAPTQPRKYATPSATSRKDVPATFARKRARSQAFGDEQDELEEDTYKLPPNPTEQELIEAKRRQNTIAARRSRKRKLEYQRELEDQVEVLKHERDEWKMRALAYHGMLKSHGIDAPEYF